MYVCVSCLSPVKAGDVLILKVDRQMGEVGAYEIGGGLIGYASVSQPDGCLDAWTLFSRIGDSRVLCKAAVSMQNTVILYTESKVFEAPERYERVEKEGYGFLRLAGPGNGRGI